MNWKVLLSGLFGIGLLVAVLAVPILKGTDPHALPSVMEGREAPSFILDSLEGETWSSESLVGKPVVLNFWATWCGPCKQEHPVLLAAARNYSDVVFLGVLYGDEPEKAKRYLARAGANYPTLVDPAQRTAMDFGVGGVPETFFINREGQIVKKVALPISMGEISHWVEAIQ
ncbi:MAG: redoxin domain-containing protein [Myxococcota bacterium]|nr:redoxin domain-containing protein [Myxococcota bacterium]